MATRTSCVARISGVLVALRSGGRAGADHELVPVGIAYAVRWLVIAAEPVTSVDVTSADMLAELDETLHAVGIKLCVAEMKDPVKDKLKRFGLFTRLGETAFFPTIGEAVDSYLVIYPVLGGERGRGRLSLHPVKRTPVLPILIQSGGACVMGNVRRVMRGQGR